MIKDELKNAKKYYKISENIKLALKYLEKTDFSGLNDGKYSIKGEDIFAIVQSYNTKNSKETLFEAHKIYTDIQFVAEGFEMIGVADLNDFFYQENFENDIEFLTPKTKTNEDEFEYIKLKKCEFVILSPQDAHKPSIGEDNHFVKKVVIKVLA